jgi:hypothetical protein
VAEQLPGKLAKSITAVSPGDEVDRRTWMEVVGTGKLGIKLKPMAERSIEPLPVSTDIESLKSKLMRHSVREIPDPSDEMCSTIEVMVCNSWRGRLKDELYEIFKIIDKVSDDDNARAIYHTLNHVVRSAIMAGRHNPNPSLIEYRKATTEWARSAKRKANVAAEERRRKMCPFVVDFLRDHEFRGLATIYKALMGRPEFRAVIPKSVNPRQIKGDIEAILVAIDTEAELRREG